MSLDDTSKALLDRFAEEVPDYAGLRTLFDVDASFHVIHTDDVDGFVVVQERDNQIHVATLHFFEVPTVEDVAALFAVAEKQVCDPSGKSFSGALSDRCIYLAQNPEKVSVLAEGFNLGVTSGVIVVELEEPTMTSVGLTYARTEPFIPRK